MLYISYHYHILHLDNFFADPTTTTTTTTTTEILRERERERERVHSNNLILLSGLMEIQLLRESLSKAVSVWSLSIFSITPV